MCQTDIKTNRQIEITTFGLRGRRTMIYLEIFFSLKMYTNRFYFKRFLRSKVLRLNIILGSQVSEFKFKIVAFNTFLFSLS